MAHRQCRNCGKPARPNLKYPLCGTCFAQPELRKNTSPKVRRAEARRAMILEAAPPPQPIEEPVLEAGRRFVQLREQELELAVPEAPVSNYGSNKLSPEQRDEVVQLVQAEPKIDLNEVAQTYGVTRQAICGLLESRGVPWRVRQPRRSPEATGAGARLDPVLVAAIREAYANPDVPLDAMSAAFNRERSTLRKVAIAAGAPARPKGNFQRTQRTGPGHFENGPDGQPHWVKGALEVGTSDNSKSPNGTPEHKEALKVTVIEAKQPSEEREIYIPLDTVAVNQLQDLAQAHKLDLAHEVHSLLEQALARPIGRKIPLRVIPQGLPQSIKVPLPPDLFATLRRVAQDQGKETRDLIAFYLFEMLPPPKPTAEETFKAMAPVPAPVPERPRSVPVASPSPAKGEHTWVMTYAIQRAMSHPARTPDEALAKLRQLVGSDVELISIVRA